MKRLQRLTQERRETIDSKIDELNERYRHNRLFDYDALCRDQDIRYYEHLDIVCPTTLPRITQGKDGRIVRHGKRDAFNFPFKLKFVGEYMKAHELAHIILDHHRDTPGHETGADYFARQITGVRFPSFVINWIGAIEIFFRNKKMVYHYKKMGESYNEDLRKLAETISPVHPK